MAVLGGFGTLKAQKQEGQAIKLKLAEAKPF